MKKLLRIAALLACATSAVPSFAQEFRLLSGWDKHYSYSPQMVDPFMKGVETGSGGRIKFIMSGPETVPPFEQLEPVSRGVFQFLFTHGAYHFGTTPAMTLVEAFDGDLAAVRASGLFDVLDKHYQRHQLKLVQLCVSPVGAYNMLLRAPVNPQGDLSGRKIRAVANYGGVVKLLNATSTVLPPSEVYTALDKGLIDGTAWPVIGMLDFRWNEVAKHVLRPSFGVNYQPLFMNLAAWNKLSKQDQELMSKVARQVEDAWAGFAPKTWAEEEEKLKAKGVTITRMGSAQAAKLQSAWASGLLEASAAKDPKLTAEVRKFAMEKGLLK